MPQVTCQPGDVLFYFNASGLTRLIQLGEDLEERNDGPWPYHCAVALNSTEKLEADFWQTSVHPIDSGYVVCRPPYPRAPQLAKALMWGRKKQGRPYGWLGVVDQALRDSTGGWVHLPRFLVEWVNNVMPYCSTLTAAVLVKALIPIELYPPPSPADVWLALKQYQVSR